MSRNDSKELIKESAINLLFVEGKFDTTSEDIADLAGVKRPLIYYYFKSVEELIVVILEESKTERDQLIFDVLNEDSTLNEKLDKIFDLHLTYTTKYPFRQVYIATHSNLSNSAKFLQSIDYQNIIRLQSLFEEGIKENLLRIKDSKQAVLLLLSFLNYPLLMRSLGAKVLTTSFDEYQKLLTERKTTFINLLFND